MLNAESPIPLYRQLADILLIKIRLGEFPPGSRIPSENILAERYAIGRPTVRQATEMLVRQRVLVRKRGSGTFVQTEKKEVDLFSFGGTMASFQKKGIPLATSILNRTRLKTIANDPENPFAKQKAYFLSRLSRVEEMPVLIEDIYLHATLFSGIDRFDLAGRSLSQIVAEHYYMRPTGGRQNFRIGYLPGKEGLNLAVSPDTPILTVKRYLHFALAQNAIFSELYCRTDQFVFSQTLGGIADEGQGLL
ncbi:MAG: GntR family transcriptional regulator [Proteobacteria bacterium]|nr:GntR family transcriptional regulator [Pseudomonadota bacterium]